MSQCSCDITGAEETISGGSAALYFSHDHSHSSLLNEHGIGIREFIVMSFLSDQGPMDIDQLARVTNIDDDTLLEGLRRLTDAGLICRRAESMHIRDDSTVILTERGEDLTTRINSQS